MEITNAALKRYYENGFSKIEGWCSEQLFHTVDLFDSLPINKGGGICEIGVHHGKFYLLLNQVTSIETRSFAIDIFEEAALNIDHSGSGNRAAFTKNLAEFDIHQGRNTVIIKGDSTDSKLQLEKTIGPGSLRFLSIDGGHTAEHTISDLKLANHLISNEGVVILDDILNAHWLGVI
jgi:Methyltransferase domain